MADFSVYYFRPFIDDLWIVGAWMPVPAHFSTHHASVNYCDISMQYCAAKKYTHHFTYAMSRNILNVLTGTHFAGFFYTN